MRTYRELFCARRYIYLALWVPNGLIVGCESLLAQRTSPAMAMVAMAVISLAVTLILTPGLRPAARAPEPGSVPQTARQTEPQ